MPSTRTSFLKSGNSLEMHRTKIGAAGSHFSKIRPRARIAASSRVLGMPYGILKPEPPKKELLWSLWVSGERCSGFAFAQFMELPAIVRPLGAVCWSLREY